MKNSTASQKIFKLIAVTMLFALLVLALSWTQSLYAAATQMYWVNYTNSSLYKAIPGATVANIFSPTTGINNPTGIALDTADGKIYWTDYKDNTISKANLDGSGVVTTTAILTGTIVDSVYGIALDTAADKMYWTHLADGKVFRADLDGTNSQDISGDVSSGLVVKPKGIALDIVNGKMYFASSGDFENPGKIYRANLDGSNRETIHGGLTNPTGIALDIAAGQMYWTDFNENALYKSALIGGAVTSLFPGDLAFKNPTGLALDIPAGKVYWGNYGDDKIYRANMDGSLTPEDITPTTTSGSVSGPHDIALVLPLPVVWDGEGTDNNWSTPENWTNDVAPGLTDSVLFDATSVKNAIIDGSVSVAELTIGAGYTGQITMNESLAVSGNYLQGGGTLVVADPATLKYFEVGGVFKQMGGVLQQTQAVSGGSKSFLQIEDDSSVVKYRGADVTSVSNLGNVTVSVKAVDQAGGEYCTTTTDMSPAYAGRCFEITAVNNLPADITLYALTSELNGITLTNIYRYVATSWVQLASSTGTDGAYSYATATTPGFSSFLMGGLTGPTAVSLQSFSAQSQNTGIGLLVILVLLLTAGSLWWLRRQN